ncbi:MAG: type IV pilus assembly protein PilM [Actinomycetota bacterium]|nr:type IV pilus assembly protein PilM [Actinomycetota bacterium]
MGRTSGKSIVGLDIEPGYVAAVEGRGGRVAVERAAMAPLSPGVVREGEVLDVDTLATVLREMFAEHKLSKRVRLGVANQRIVMRTIDLPPLNDEKQLASAIRFQAQEHIPMPLDQAVLEHHSLGLVETPEGTRSRVVLVAARRDMIDSLLEATRRAGLRPQGIDLSAFAMIRALYHPGADDATLYMSVGGVTNLAVALGTTCVFTRVVPHGTEAMAGELAERRGLTLEHAHGWLKHIGLLMPVDDIDGDREIIVEARTVLGEGVRRIVDDVRNSLDFYTMQPGAAAVGRVVLTGPAVSIPGFSEQLDHGLSLPLEVGVVSEGRPGAFGKVDAGNLAVAAGLTLEEVPA